MLILLIAIYIIDSSEQSVGTLGADVNVHNKNGLTSTLLTIILILVKAH